MSRPLLLACSSLYLGPWVPTIGLKGTIRSEGLVDRVDEVVVRIRDVTEQEEDTIITIDADMEIKIDLTGALIRAERTKSSGSEVFIWLS